ncbi:Hypothetical predicted protein [Marmota monax]|uniref:Uncharacterized protein n=1 Tax=Marmota monax TaxID=9995 RepID=A0A5E4BKT4_MARMO|nr:hypothetical protein GHT09_009136 [Marmota monax]VTJ69601.1 Hypothetical predicted protein [Marmota monax]
MLGSPGSNAHSWAAAAGIRCCALLRPGQCLGVKKVPEAPWRKKHAGCPQRRDWQADTPGLQLYAGSSLGPNEFHRGGRPLCSLLYPSVFSRDQVLRVLAKDEEQLSLLRDLEGLKPQKVRTALDSGTPPPEQLAARLPVLLPLPYLPS